MLMQPFADRSWLLIQHSAIIFKPSGHFYVIIIINNGSLATPACQQPHISHLDAAIIIIARISGALACSQPSPCLHMQTRRRLRRCSAQFAKDCQIMEKENPAARESTASTTVAVTAHVSISRLRLLPPAGS
jgi:hypothetical protein